MQQSSNFAIEPNFNPNKLLAVNKSNKQHDEIKTRMITAQKSNALHINNMNLDTVLPSVSIRIEISNVIFVTLGFQHEELDQT